MSSVPWARRIALKLARSRIGAAGLALALRYTPTALPVQRLYLDDQTVVIRHPVPLWDTHVLAMPRRRIPSFSALNLNSERDTTILLSILGALQANAAEGRMAPYTILVNGGQYQDVPLLHFHLSSGEASDGSVWGTERWEMSAYGSRTVRQGDAVAYPHPNPSREFHSLICSEVPLAPFERVALADDGPRSRVIDMLALAQQLIARHSLPAYALLLNAAHEPPEEQLSLHLVAGERV